MSSERTRALIDLAVAATLLAFAAITITLIIPVEVLEPRTRFGSAQGAVSPAALPNIISILIGAVAFLYLLRSIARLANINASTNGSLKITWQLLAITACSAAYIITLNRISFVYTTPVYLVASYLVMLPRPWRERLLELLSVAIGAVGLTLVVRLIFERGLQVYLGT